ncbi:TPA: sialate O-acetylesterase [Elizabethkingia anophelis]
MADTIHYTKVETDAKIGDVKKFAVSGIAGDLDEVAAKDIPSIGYYKYDIFKAKTYTNVTPNITVSPEELKNNIVFGVVNNGIAYKVLQEKLSPDTSDLVTKEEFNPVWDFLHESGGDPIETKVIDPLPGNKYIDLNGFVLDIPDAKFTVYEITMIKGDSLQAILSTPVNQTGNSGVIMARYSPSGTLLEIVYKMSESTQPSKAIDYTTDADCIIRLGNWGSNVTPSVKRIRRGETWKQFAETKNIDQRVNGGTLSSAKGLDMWDQLHTTKTLTPETINPLSGNKYFGANGIIQDIPDTKFTAYSIVLLKGENIHAELSRPTVSSSNIAFSFAVFSLSGERISVSYPMNTIPYTSITIDYIADQDCEVRFGNYDTNIAPKVIKNYDPIVFKWKEIYSKEDIEAIIEEYNPKESGYFLNSDINHIIGYGQSLSTGAESGGAITTAPFNNNVLMIQGSGFVPYYNSGDENPLAGLGIALSELNDITDSKVLMTSHGVGGYSIEQLSKGTAPYNNLLSAVTQALNIATNRNESYSVFAVAWTQGESNYIDSPEVYKGKLKQLKSDLNADIKAITSQNNDIIFVMYQPSSWNSEHPTSTMATAYIDLALNEKGFYCANPQYDKNYVHSSNGVYLHMFAESYRRMGAEYGFAIHKILNEKDYKPLHISDVSYKGKIINVVFSEPVVVDKTLVSGIANLGFDVIGNSITSVKITKNRATIICGSNVASGNVLTYGFNGTDHSGWEFGERGNLRSPNIQTLSFGNIYKWLAHQRFKF